VVYEQIAESGTVNILKSKPLQWFVLKTMPQKESVVLFDLNRKGFTSCLPLIKKKYERKGRIITSYRPLISSYVFVKATIRDTEKLRYIIGSKYLLKCRCNYITLRETDIENMKLFCLKDTCPQVITQYKKGEKVRIICGLLKGVEGEVLEKKKKNNIVINSGIPGVYFVIDLENTLVEKINR